MQERVSNKVSQKNSAVAIHIKQKDPNEKFLKSMKRIQDITSEFFNDLSQDVIKQSIWTYKMHQVRKQTLYKTSTQIEKQVASNFFKNWKAKPNQKKKQVWIIDRTKDVHQQNMYSNYVPISQNVLPDDFLLQIFPVIEKIDLSNIINELKMKEDLPEEKRLKSWLKITRRMNLFVDVEQKIWIWYIYKVYKKSLECTSFMQIFFKQPQVKQQNFSLKYTDVNRIIQDKQYKQIEWIEQHKLLYSITIDKIDEHIDPIIDLTAIQKHYFCNKCYIYDCRIHSYERKKGYDFYHPSTYFQNSKPYQRRILLSHISFYKSIIFNPDHTFIPNENEKYCGDNCYLSLTREKLMKIRQSRVYPQNYTELEKIFITLGEKRLSYNICSMALLQLSFKCDLLFLHIVEDYLLQNDLEIFSLANIAVQEDKQNSNKSFKNTSQVFSSQQQQPFDFQKHKSNISKQDQQLSNEMEVIPQIIDQSLLQVKDEVQSGKSIINDQSYASIILNKKEIQTKQEQIENKNDWDDDDDPWQMEDNNDNQQQMSNQRMVNENQNNVNLSSKLFDKKEYIEESNDHLVNYLKVIVDNYNIAQETTMKREKIEIQQINNLIQDQMKQLDCPQQELSDEDEGQQDKNNIKFDPYDSDQSESSVKTSNQENSEDAEDSYQHCVHYRHNKQPVDQECKHCCCRKRGFCDQYCLCDPRKCKIQRLGCDCKDSCQKNVCNCFKKNLECDPEYCLQCFDCKSKCNNNHMILNKTSRVVIANSEICGGMGIFNLYPLQKGDLIIVYYGEILSDQDIVIRDSWKPSDLFYIFSLMEDLTVDSKYLGNKSRFMNHSKNKDNAHAKMVYVRGGYQIGLYASNNIVPGTELLFDYDGQGTLKHKYEWIQKKADSKAKSNDANLIVFQEDTQYSHQKKMYNKFKKGR